MKKELIWPGTIILASIIIGGSLLMVQNNKQESIERQKRADIQLERDKEQAKADEAKKVEADKAYNKIMLSACLEDARVNAWEFVKLNGTPVAGKDDVYNAPNWVWDDYDEKKKRSEDLCFKKY